ncbi:MAG: response regulator transcription factor [Xanthomonadales bacterium]|jgi:NarL family two-component system response regulator LiaR|nr:response regulator transcription factor [Xanthomonadales bacterium]
MSLRVLLVDDHAVVRQGLRAYLELQPGMTVCGEAADAAHAVQLAAELQPDVALVDLVMPVEDGVSATRRIRACSPTTEVLVLTSCLESHAVAPAFAAGACGYTLKEIAGSELLDGIFRVARGERVLHPRLFAFAAPAARRSRQIVQSDPCVALSAREREVLLLLADGCSNTQIAERLGIGESTVKTHVGNVLGKLDLADRTQAAVWAWKQRLVGGQ